MKVLITRPSQAAACLAATLTAEAIASICFPSIEIEPLASIAPFTASLQSCELVIFVSAHAVHQYFTMTGRDILANKTVLAIGEATAKCLEQRGVSVADFPIIANSENLLTSQYLQQVKGQQVIIFAGLDGREHLQTTLQQRGAEVKMIYLYHRIVPCYVLPLTWQVSEIDLSITTSGQGLTNFDQLINQYNLHRLYQKPLLVITKVMIEQARQLGFKSAIICANSASNTDVLAAIQKDMK